jgi:hypothetical protein
MFLVLVAFGCDGRYTLGSAAGAAGGGAAHGGQGESGANAGSAGSAGTDGTAGGAGTLGTDGGTAGASEPKSLGGAGDKSDGGAFNEGGAAGEAPIDPGALDRVRWLMVETFPSSASSQTLLELVDLQRPTWSGVTVESTSATNVLPSSDQRWVLYASSHKSAALGNVYDYYVVNTAGKTPGERQLLLSDQPSWSSCLWSPDASHLACTKRRADVDSDALELVLFEVTGSSIGPEIDVGPLLGTPSFIGASSVVYTNLESEILRFDFGVDAPATPTRLGVTADYFVASPDGQRGFAKTYDPEHSSLFDVRTGTSQVLDLPFNFVVNADFEIGLSWVEDADDTKRTYTYYAVNGLQPSPVGQLAVQVPARVLPPLRMVGRSVVHVDGSQLVFVHVPESGEATPRTVPGDFAAVQRYLLDPTGRFLYFSSAELDGGVAIPSTIEHWLSRLGPAGAEPPQLLAEGFAASSVAFSPDGTRLLLAGNTYNDEEPQPAPIHLITLSEAAQPLDRLLPLPLNWVEATFSRDSSYLAIIGGSLSNKARELYALDLLAADATAQLLFSCTSNPAPLPGCPNIVTF